METRLKQELESIRGRGELRRVLSLQSPQGRVIRHAGREFVNFSSNNYLGLAEDPRLKAAMAAGIERWGVGSGAARLVNGSMEVYDRLEAALAAFKGFQAALLFNSGYHANIGALSCLLKEGDLVCSDEWNHASIIDGIRLAKAERGVYRHLDLNDLEDKMKRYRGQANGTGLLLIASEAVFSMDGDLADLSGLLELAERYDAYLYLDEAHATGVLGKKGAGLCETLSSEQRRRVIAMGTLGKALGCFGAYICASEIVIEFLRQRARSFVFTTTFPPAVAEAALTALEICENDPALRENLWARIRQLHSGIEGSAPRSPIIPLIVGEAERAVTLSQRLRDAGYWVNAIRPPTVPVGTSRLRITLMASHTQEDVQGLLGELKKAR